MIALILYSIYAVPYRMAFYWSDLSSDNPSKGQASARGRGGGKLSCVAQEGLGQGIARHTPCLIARSPGATLRPLLTLPSLRMC